MTFQEKSTSVCCLKKAAFGCSVKIGNQSILPEQLPDKVTGYFLIWTQHLKDSEIDAK